MLLGGDQLGFGRGGIALRQIKFRKLQANRAVVGRALDCVTKLNLSTFQVFGLKQMLGALDVEVRFLVRGGAGAANGKDNLQRQDDAHRGQQARLALSHG